MAGWAALPLGDVAQRLCTVSTIKVNKKGALLEICKPSIFVGDTHTSLESLFSKSRVQGRIFIFFSWGCKKFRGVVMIMCRGGSRVFDDRFTRFTQVIGGSGGMPPGQILKFGALKQHFLRSSVTF